MMGMSVVMGEFVYLALAAFIPTASFEVCWSESEVEDMSAQCGTVR